jgi:hypothetical protein
LKSPTHPKDFVGRAATFFQALMKDIEIMENERQCTRNINWDIGSGAICTFQLNVKEGNGCDLSRRIRSQIRPRGIYGEHCDTGTGFLRVHTYILPILIPSTDPPSFPTIRGWYIDLTQDDMKYGHIVACFAESQQKQPLLVSGSVAVTLWPQQTRTKQ